MLSKNDPVFDGNFNIDPQYRAVGSILPPRRKVYINYVPPKPMVKENKQVMPCTLNPDSPPFVPRESPISTSNPEKYSNLKEAEPLPKMKNSKSSADIKSIDNNGYKPRKYYHKRK